MNNQPKFEDLTPEQQEQVKALETKIYKRSMSTSARNAMLVVGAGLLVGFLNAKFIHSAAFLVAGSLANGLLFIRQIRLDLLEENKIIAEELQKIFK